MLLVGFFVLFWDFLFEFFFTLFFFVEASATERSHIFRESGLEDTNSEHVELFCSTQKYP